MKKRSFILLPAIMMVLSACGGGATSGSTTTSPTTDPTTDPTTEPVEKTALQVAYEACEALENNAESADAYEFDGVIVAVNGNSFFVQKGDYGLQVYSSTAYEGVAVGKSVVVNAKLKKYNGMLETGTVNSVTVGEDSALPEAVTVSSLAELAALKQNILVDYVAGLPADAPDWSSSAHALATVTLGSDSITAKFDKAGYTAEKGAIYDSAKGHSLKITNAVTAAFDTTGASTVNQSLVVGSSELELIEVPATAVTISADKTEVDVGGVVTLSSVVTPADSTDAVSYIVTEGQTLCSQSGNTLIASAAGTVKVMAAAGEVHSEEITITINEAADPIVSISAVGPTSKTSGDTLTASEVTVTASKQSGATEVLTSGYTIEGGESYTFTDEDAAAGSKVVAIAYMELSTSITVSVAVKDRSVKTAYEAAAALANKAESASAYEFDGVVTSMLGNAFFVQDNGYGMYVYASSAYEGVAVGKKVRVNSKLKNFYGCLETGTITSVTVLGDGEVPAAVKVSTKAELAALKQNVLIDIVATMPDSASLKTWNASSPANNTVTLPDGNTSTASFQKGAYTADKGTVYTSLAGKSTKFTSAISTAYSSTGAVATNQFFVAGATSFEENVVPATAVTCSASADTVEVGSSVTLSSVVTPSDSTDAVSYEITSGSDYATLSGNTLVGVAAGTVTVVAKAGSVSSDPVTITVTAAADPVTSIEVSGPSSKLSGETLASSEITVTAHKESGATEVVTTYTASETLPYTFTDDDATAGSKVITITYAEKTADLTITVVAPVYKLSCPQLSSGTEGYNTNYGASVDYTENSVTWSVNANTSLASGWRFGGKSLTTDTDKTLYSKTAITGEVNYIALSIGGIGTTTSSLSVSVHSTADDAAAGLNPVVTFTPTLAANSTIEISKEDATSWAGCYYRIVFTITVTGSSNKGVDLKSLSFANK